MFLSSGPELVIACCKAGIVGTFPAKNQRTIEGLDAWLDTITSELAAFEAETGPKAAPFGVNLIVHKSNERGRNATVKSYARSETTVAIPATLV